MIDSCSQPGKLPISLPHRALANSFQLLVVRRDPPGMASPGRTGLGATFAPEESMSGPTELGARFAALHSESFSPPNKELTMKMSSWFSKMIGTSMTLDNLENVLILQLRDLSSAEEQLIEALPKMANAANSQELSSAFETHLTETRGHKDRLDRAFRLLGQEPGSETCEAMKGLIAEGQEVIGLEGDAEVKDAALIAAAQRVEHYEIAGYGCARSFARRIGRNEVAALLQETLEEEANADKILTHIADSGVNAEAARS
jgi:ferritin-like metal-binding protein YciE